MKFIDLTGKKFGRLIVIKRVDNDKWRNTRWLCKCDCEVEKIVYGRSLREGDTKSCGCLQREIARDKKNLTPGLSSMRNIIDCYKRKAKARGYEWGLTEEQFKEITQKDCYYCGAKPNNVSKHKKSNGNYLYNGIDRVNNTKGYIIDNVVPCCHTCNQAKSDLTLEKFKDWIKRVSERIL